MRISKLSGLFAGFLVYLENEISRRALKHFSFLNGRYNSQSCLHVLSFDC